MFLDFKQDDCEYRLNYTFLTFFVNFVNYVLLVMLYPVNREKN